jgi:predicted phage tail protein
MAAGSAPSANWQIGAGAVTSNSATFVHTWSEAPGNYTLNVTPLSSAGCTGETKAYTIEVFASILPTEPNITAIAVGTACPITLSNPTSTANVNLTVVNIPATSTYKVWYSIDGAEVATPANIAAGATSFSIDASGIAAGGSATVAITKFQVGTDPLVSFSGPTGTLNVSSVPVVNGIE